MPLVGRDIDEAARRLLRGEPVAFATETVYGLGAAAANPRAVSAMYRMKNRPRAHPCIIHLADFSAASEWAEVPPSAQKLAAAFMPGALTLLLPAKPSAKHVGDGRTVALRAPAHPLAQKLLARTGEGIAAPSANRFGKLSPTCAAHVRAEFADEESLYILDGGQCEVGLESAIVSCLDGRVSVVRPGVISAAQIAAAAQTPLSPPPAVAAPGNLRSHYAPQKPFFVAPPDSFSAAGIKKFGEKFGDNAAVLSRRRPCEIPPSLWRRAADAPREYARNLYAILRELDALAAECIVAELPPDSPEWTAARDRLFRAAGTASFPALPKS